MEKTYVFLAFLSMEKRILLWAFGLLNMCNDEFPWREELNMVLFRQAEKADLLGQGIELVEGTGAHAGLL